METDIAKKISDEMNDILGRLNESIRLVRDNCSEEEFKGYRKAVSRVAASLVLDVMNPLYDINPEVKPDGYDDV